MDVKGKKVTWHGCAARVITVRDMSWRSFLRKEKRAIDIVIEDDSQFGELVGKNDMMKKVYEYILRAAVSDAPVLISGETGSGKEIAARTIFKMSENYNNNFVTVNCWPYRKMMPCSVCSERFTAAMAGPHLACPTCAVVFRCIKARDQDYHLAD